MTLGDFLTVISLFFAMFSFAYGNNRKIIIYKISCFYIVCIGLLFLLVIYLLMFNRMQELGFYIKCLYNDKGILWPCQWAFIVSVVLIFTVGWKFFKSKRIPRCKEDGLIVYYEDLMNSNISLLIYYINTYHKNKLHKYLMELDASIEEEEKNKDEIPNFEFDKDDEIQENKQPLEAKLLDRIIFNSLFITQSIDNGQPLYFIHCVQGLKHEVAGYSDAVETYYSHLIRNGNNRLTEALNTTNNYLHDVTYPGVAYQIGGNEMRQLTFGCLQFTCRLNVWRVFGEEGLRDAATNSFYARRTNEWSEYNYNRLPARLCLSFYDILLREIIYHRLKEKTATEEEEHIYLYYIYLIAEEAVKGLGQKAYHGSFAEKLVNDTLSCLHNWLDILAKYNSDLYLSSIWHIEKSFICISSLSEKDKVDIAKQYIEVLLNFKNICEDRKMLQAFKEICFMSPTIIRQGWNNIDKIRYQDFLGYEELKEVVEKIP